MNTKGIPFNPDGYNKVYNEKNELYLEGIFKNGLLWDGKHYLYDRDAILLKVEVYKDGKYFSEGQI
jgi:antitoxin component YwqK of YwqJK toxin-antitoxin module